jgi:hypothetical protein
MDTEDRIHKVSGMILRPTFMICRSGTGGGYPLGLTQSERRARPI